MDANYVNGNAEPFKALAHPNRLQIVHELLSPSNISQHLTVLRRARVTRIIENCGGIVHFK